jgi:hypothetical protein
VSSKYVRRHLVEGLLRALESSRVVQLTGPRQAGKSTLVKMLDARVEVVTLDDDVARLSLQSDGYGQLKRMRRRAAARGVPVVVDEIQRLPELSLAIKRIVDEDPAPGQFLLTGSADILTSGATTDSLAGRVVPLRLLPFSAAEVRRRGPCRIFDLVESSPDAFLTALPDLEPVNRDEVLDLLYRGGFPEMRETRESSRAERFEAYTDTLVERDAAQLYALRRPDELRRLVMQCAVRSGQELRVTDLCGALGVQRDTMLRWLELLERLSLFQRVGAWTGAAAGREVKAPKLHFLDSGLGMALRGEDPRTFDLTARPQALGPVLESWVFAELMKAVPMARRRWRPWHWRADRREVDMVWSGPSERLFLAEVQASSTLRESDAAHLRWFMTDGPGRQHECCAVIFYLGSTAFALAPRVYALPLSVFWAWED